MPAHADASPRSPLAHTDQGGPVPAGSEPRQAGQHCHCAQRDPRGRHRGCAAAAASASLRAACSLPALHTSALCLPCAISPGADLVVLPEMWNCPYSNDSFPTYAEELEGPAAAAPSAAMLAAAAADNRVVLVRRERGFRGGGRAGREGWRRRGGLAVAGRQGGAGSQAGTRRSGWRPAAQRGAPRTAPLCRHGARRWAAPSRSAPTEASCTTPASCTAATAACWAGTARCAGWARVRTSSSGTVVAPHLPPDPLPACLPPQVHLFDIDIPGKITFKESLTLTPGEGLTVVDTEARGGGAAAGGAAGCCHACCQLLCCLCALLSAAVLPLCWVSTARVLHLPCRPCPHPLASACNQPAGGPPGYRHLL